MKRPLIILAIFLVTLSANAQINKIFLNTKGAEVDSTHADKYVMCDKLSDTAWLMKLYKMNDTIIEEGTYKDQKLTIPNGKFIYYYKDSIEKDSKVADNVVIDTLNYINLKGNYVNGVKTGKWISYFPNGGIDKVKTFSDNKLNGLYEIYNFDTNTVLLSGDYIDDMRQGEWHLLDCIGNITNIDTYKDDRIIKSKEIPSPYEKPEPPKDFIKYLSKNAHYLSKDNIIKGNIIGCVILNFDITAQGKLINPKIFAGTISVSLSEKLLSILSNSPDWKPAYNNALKENIISSYKISVNVHNSDLKFLL